MTGRRDTTTTDDFTATVREFAAKQTAQSRDSKRETWQTIKTTMPDLAALMTELHRIDPRAISRVTLSPRVSDGRSIEITPDLIAALRRNDRRLR
jgi:hypothetical protein